MPEEVIEEEASQIENGVSAQVKGFDDADEIYRPKRRRSTGLQVLADKPESRLEPLTPLSAWGEQAPPMGPPRAWSGQLCIKPESGLEPLTPCLQESASIRQIWPVFPANRCD
jgi:hypothetical protein